MGIIKSRKNIGHLRGHNYGEIPFFKELTQMGENFEWIPGFLEEEKLRTAELPALREERKRLREAPLNIDGLMENARILFDEYNQRRRQILTEALKHRDRPLEKVVTQSRALEGIINSYFHDIPPFLTWEELEASVKEIAAENPGVSQSHRDNELRKIDAEIEDIESHLFESQRPYMPPGRNPREGCMRAVFVNHWRELQYFCHEAVGPQGYEITISDPKIQAAHKALGLQDWPKAHDSQRVKPAISRNTRVY